MLYMGLNENNIPFGWDIKPWGNAIPVGDDIMVINQEHPDWRWNNITCTLEPVVVEYNTYVMSEEDRISMLWQAAHNYEFSQISGSAIGLLTLGVLQQLPKCLAVQNWIKSIWTLYYERKSTTSYNFIFTSCGPCPHTVPELMTELGL